MAMMPGCLKLLLLLLLSGLLAADLHLQDVVKTAAFIQEQWRC